jgi:hypothetical protein
MNKEPQSTTSKEVRAEEVLADIFEANLTDLSDLQLQIILNPSIDRIKAAMEEYHTLKSVGGYSDPVYRWVKASERLPVWKEKVLRHLEQRITYVCIKVDGLYFSAYFNHDTNTFEVKHNPKVHWKPNEHNIEWLEKIQSLSTTIQKQEDKNKFTPEQWFYNILTVDERLRLMRKHFPHYDDNYTIPQINFLFKMYYNEQ